MPTAADFHDHVLLVSRFLRNPRTVGAFAPSSRPLAEAMSDHLDPGNASRVAELGPGTGAFTASLLSSMADKSKLLAVEIDPVFASALQRRWPDLDVACAAAETLPDLMAARGGVEVDHVISGLPFVTLPAAVVTRTLHAVAATLRPGGTFTTFQYAHCYTWPSASAFRKEVSAILGADAPTSRLIVPNVPPAVVLRWTRG
jgi:phosphatidylethanolamine/phosphatidyl-N-methylethanolamine N-methyltransferase